MNHGKIYDRIIEKAKSENRQRHQGTYYEEHHINPKCLGGNNDKDNLVLLTAREHFICHKLLTYIYKGNRKLICALHRMTHSKKYGKLVSSRDYAYVTELHKLTPLSQETKDRMSIAQNKRYISLEERNKSSQKGNKNGMFGKGPMFGKNMSEQHKQSLRNLYEGKTLEEIYGEEKGREIRKTMSENRIGEGNSFFGKHHSEETIQILKEKKRKHLISFEIIDIIKKDRTLMKLNELQIKYPEYKRTTLQRIVAGEYDNGYYETKGNR